MIDQEGTPLESIRLPSGEVLDFIDRATLPTLPYALPSLLWKPEDMVLPPGVELGLSELEPFPELVALAETATMFHRPEFWEYIEGGTDAVSIEDYLERYQVGGKPSDAERLYAGLWSNEPNRGVSGFMNQFRPEVEPGSFSLLEFAVGCPAEGPVQEQIGVVISVDKVNPFGRNRRALTDGEPRLHIEYGRQKDGQIKYDWDSADGAFKPNPMRHLYHPGQKVPVSTLGGTQVEHLIGIFQVPTGDWWIAYNHELLGYYPASLFTMLNGGACMSAWYGEVARRTPASPTGPPKIAMGSGMFAAAGPGKAASVRNPRYYDLLWFGYEPTDDGSNDMTPNVPSCYTRTRLRDGPAPGDRISFLGGHGDKAQGCTWPSP